MLLFFSRLAMSNSLRPHGLQHARLPFLHYLSEFVQTHVHWVDDSIQQSHPLPPVFPCPQSFPASRSFPVSIQDWFPLGLTGLILLSKGLWRVFSSTTVWRHQFFSTQPFLLFSCLVISDSLWPHGLHHARLPCPSPSPGACSNSCPLFSDAIQPSHHLLSPSPPAFSLA